MWNCNGTHRKPSHGRYYADAKQQWCVYSGTHAAHLSLHGQANNFILKGSERIALGRIIAEWAKNGATDSQDSQYMMNN